MSSSEWREVKLGEVVIFNPKELLAKGSIVKKISMDKLLAFQRKIEGYEMAPFSGGTKFRNGDTLLARITPSLENGKTAQVTILEENEVGFGSTEFIVLRGKENHADNDFVFNLARTASLREVAIKSMAGTSGRQRVQSDVLGNTLIKIPPLQEQKAIAHILSTLDEKIETNNKINKTLEEMAQEIFKHWFVDFEFPNEDGEPYKSSGGEMIDSELGPIPKGWEVVTLYDLANYINGTSFKKDELGSEGEPVIKIAEIKNGYNSSTLYYNGYVKKDNKYYLRQKDILFSWSGNPETSIDIFIWIKNEGILNQHIFKVEPINLSRSFVFLLLKTYKPIFTEIASQKQTTGLGHVTIADLKRLKTCIPDGTTLTKFNGLSEDIIEKIYCNNKGNEILKQIRDTLLPKLMSGEIRVPIDNE